jgi:indolepyruvate ferredoxin oxidoreductase
VTGVPAKRRYGPWIRPFLAVLAKLKGLRGTMLDPFGHTEERRRERRLIADYEKLVDELVASLARGKLDVAVQLAELPASIRGYGHVKLANLEAAKKREAALLAELRASQPEPVAMAAD